MPQSFVNIPLIIESTPVGVINVCRYAKAEFQEREIKLLYTFANHTARAVQRLRQAIAEQKSLLETMVQSMTDGVIMVNENDEIVLINPAAKKMVMLNVKSGIKLPTNPV